MITVRAIYFSITIFFLSTFVTSGQSKGIHTSRDYPQGYFQFPMKIAPQASGTFGELRNTHFHAGDDYRTQQRTGIAVHAAAEGHISRVRVQIGGGGNIVYIDHPNGFTTVHMHLNSFSQEIADFVKQEQYKQKRFDVDLELKKGQIQVAKGQLIGRSGNTGASGGPHLHLEIRDTKTQKPLNPQLFGLHFPDALPPVINSLIIYDLKQEAPFDEHTPRRSQTVQNAATGKYRTPGQAISVNGAFGVGIGSYDRHNSTTFRNGIYSIEVFLDDELYSLITFEELDFDYTRAIHSYIDYPHFQKTKARVQKTFKDPNSPLGIYKKLKNRGIIELTDQELHQVKVVVKDVHNNKSELNFQVRNNPDMKIATRNYSGGKWFNYNTPNEYKTDDLMVHLNQNTLYDRVYFVYSKSNKPQGAYSSQHHIHNTMTSLYNPYTLAIRAEGLPEHLESKALIVSSFGVSQGGEYKDGWVSTTTRSFGNFYITVDTTAPTISPRNISPNKNVARQATIDFTIQDNLSGIKSFNGYIDGQWVLMEYDPKNKHLWHKFESGLSKGKHNFKLEVTDWKNNTKTYTVDFLN